MPRPVSIAATFLSLILTSHRGWPASLTPLGGLPGGGLQSLPAALSADGRVVVGRSASAKGGRAFRWTRSDGMTDLGVLESGTFGSAAVGVSAEGDVVVGNSSSTRFRTGVEPFRWTAARGMERLPGQLPEGVDGVEARAVSADGSVIVGTGWVPSPQNITTRRMRPLQWTATHGWQVLGGFESLASQGTVSAISADGMVSVGVVFDPRLGDPVSWTIGAGWSRLATPREDAYEGAGPMAVSANGRFIVGSVTIASQQYACRWTDGTGPMFLKESPPAFQSGIALGVSDDGNVIVGDDGHAGVGLGAFVWEPRTGMRSLWERLVELGVDPATQAWQSLGGPQAVSGNGRFMCGFGFRGRSDQGYLVDLAPDLKYRRVAEGLQLSWPAGFTLERSASLAPVSWEQMPDARSPLVVPANAQPQYFRLPSSSDRAGKALTR